LNKPLKKLDQKRYESFKILKVISQGVFQLELPEGWMIYNVFNEDLLIQCKEQGQHMDSAPLPDIINKEKEYKVEEIRKHWKKKRETQYLVHWKGYKNKHDQ